MAGRPKAVPQLTNAQIVKLAAMGCSDDEIATLCGIGEATLQRNFEAQLKEGRASLRKRLRLKQIDRAMAGSDTMLIWLGKQYLEQRDKQEMSGDPERPLSVFSHGTAVASLARRSTSDHSELGADQGGGDG